MGSSWPWSYGTRVRKDCQLNEKWKTGRPWLVFLENNTMACNVCINHYGKNLSGSREQNTFISGCSNLKVLAVSGHERSKMHLWKIIRQGGRLFFTTVWAFLKRCDSLYLSDSFKYKRALPASLVLTFASVLADDLSQMHFTSFMAAIAPLSDFTWLCELDMKPIS
jgi:hypothetical protein